jgi:hypothetical protein
MKLVLLPVTSKVAPWHGQRYPAETLTNETAQHWCVQPDETATYCPAAWQTTMIWLERQFLSEYPDAFTVALPPAFMSWGYCENESVKILPVVEQGAPLVPLELLDALEPLELVLELLLPLLLVLDPLELVELPLLLLVLDPLLELVLDPLLELLELLELPLLLPLLVPPPSSPPEPLADPLLEPGLPAPPSVHGSHGYGPSGPSAASLQAWAAAAPAPRTMSLRLPTTLLSDIESPKVNTPLVPRAFQR